MLGIGGGVLVVPALTFLAKYRQKEAQAASLWYVVPTSLLAGALYLREHEDLHLGYVTAMVAAALVGVWIGVPLVKRIHQRKLRLVFGIALVLIACIMIWKATTQLEPAGGLSRSLVLTWTGLAAGFLSSLLGIGGGVVVVPALVLMGGFDQKVAQGMSLLYIVPTGLFSAILYFLHAKIRIDPSRTAAMALGGLIGAVLGFQIVQATAPDTLQIIFAASVVLIAAAMIWRARRVHRGPYIPDWVI